MRIVAAGGADISITSPLQSAGADALTNSTSGIPTYDLLSGFNGTTWDRLRALGDDADGVASASLGRLLALARLSAFNGSTYDRLLSEGNDRDAIANTTLGNLQTLGFQHVYNGATWDRATLLTDASDAVATDTSFGQGGIVRATGFNGSTYDRIRTLGATSLLGLGQLSASPAVPGASTVTSVIKLTVSDSTTRVTVITPTSGKKIRVIGWLARSGTATGHALEIYFGTGANVTTNPASAIADASMDNDNWANIGEDFPDGGGPVGAADEVLSLRTSVNVSGSNALVLHYREE